MTLAIDDTRGDQTTKFANQDLLAIRVAVFALVEVLPDVHVRLEDVWRNEEIYVFANTKSNRCYITKLNISEDSGRLSVWFYRVRDGVSIETGDHDKIEGCEWPNISKRHDHLNVVRRIMEMVRWRFN